MLCLISTLPQPRNNFPKYPNPSKTICIFRRWRMNVWVNIACIPIPIPVRQDAGSCVYSVYKTPRGDAVSFILFLCGVFSLFALFNFLPRFFLLFQALKAILWIAYDLNYLWSTLILNVTWNHHIFYKSQSFKIKELVLAADFHTQRRQRSPGTDRKFPKHFSRRYIRKPQNGEIYLFADIHGTLEQCSTILTPEVVPVRKFLRSRRWIVCSRPSVACCVSGGIACSTLELLTEI